MSASPSTNVHCSRCGFESPAGFAFCGRCGAALNDQNSAFTPIQVEKQPDKSEDTAERRQLTVVFCDLVGSTALSEQLDPEDLRQVMFAYREVCSKVTNRFEGYIAQFLGDGLLVYFGYPVAHEDDAQRAVRTGLGIVEAIRNLNPSLEKERGVKLAVRLGIHTGLVVAGDMATGDQLQPKAVVGETPNVAARVQSLAEPDSIVISQAAHRLVQGYFDLRNQGEHSLAASLPDRIETWTENGVRLRAGIWEEVILPGAIPAKHAKTFRVYAIHDPAYATPWLLATTLKLKAVTMKAIYQDRWPVEQIPLAAKQMVGAHRQFVHADESHADGAMRHIQRLPELALLAGSILSYLAATSPPAPTGFWDRQPKHTPGRFRRMLMGKPFPQSYPLPGQIRKKASVTSHLPKGILAHSQKSTGSALCATV